ncbi:MAG: L,D-transpeptidase family protein [Steroidobacteraceae bacterium]
MTSRSQLTPARRRSQWGRSVRPGGADRAAHAARFARNAGRRLLATAALAALLPLGGTVSAHSERLERVSITPAGSLAQPPRHETLGTSELPVADHVVVRKSLRRLYLMRGNTVLRSYKVALGLNPVGQKERSGDFRTPEGRYHLTRRNPRSDYFLSIQVSYPNDADLRRAQRHRWEAGGSIMIHGLPNHLSRPPQYYEKYDWTDGCIAVSDSDMLEIWLMTRENTPIDILP